MIKLCKKIEYYGASTKSGANAAICSLFSFEKISVYVRETPD